MVTKKIAIYILLPLFLITIGYCFALGQTENKLNPAQQDIIIKTNKSIYALGEDVELTLVNNSTESIYSIAASSTSPDFAIENIEKQLSDGTWRANAVRCRFPECDIDHDPPVEIKPNTSVTFRWEPVIHIKGEGIKNRIADSGVYRISVAYQFRKGDISENWKWFTAKTNNFIIK